MKRIQAQQFTESVTHHGEGPVWLGRHGLAVLDMLAGDVVLIDERGAQTRREHLGEVVAALRPRRVGGFVAGLERGFCLLNEHFAVTEAVTCWTDPSVRMNDGACDPMGRFWCGSMAYDLTPGAGALWRFEPSGDAVEVITGIGCSNGLAWNRDGTRAYYVDSLTGRIDVLELGPDGQIADRRPYTDTVGDGFPDGIAVDLADGVWLASFGSGLLRHFDHKGRHDADITVPVRQVTACTFAGPDYSELYITTSRFGLQDPEAAAGAVFRAKPDTGGFAPYTFGG
ncbi:SMP-30/gluconolactonase/LRE family protein [Nocardia sp. NEAU-G5]|uniref:SMP-30/gluconolactonase/LRE family protein n=1 Tax=Nocardia albiluteola TaxID=2842303 RepID=A0ABS6BBN7_9NOCA|nr:SMP-30/gluconolactonase/LRE family protein [Nocardia albiluteola]MBU3067697.1 SMP-30/gluconolactonase/LRE family protein [Nocardia albiluteola]